MFIELAKVLNIQILIKILTLLLKKNNPDLK